MLSKETIKYCKLVTPVNLDLDEPYTVETGESECLVIQELKAAVNYQPVSFKKYSEARAVLVNIEGQSCWITRAGPACIS